MKKKNSLQSQYSTLHSDPFPRTVRLSFEFGENSGENSSLTELLFKKVEWSVEGETRGLRYGENPHQEAGLYKLVNGNITLAGTEYIGPQKGLVTEAELLQGGKHPGKINITDVDSALGILKHLPDSPATVIVKHNNPCGVSQKDSLAESYRAAFDADPIAAFGGAVVCNREMDRETAGEIASRYTEVAAAPEYAEGALEILQKRKNIRIFRVPRMDRLSEYLFHPYVDITSLMDGGLILQKSYETKIQGVKDFLPAEAHHNGKDYRCNRAPSKKELEDLLFGWRVETGITSNSVVYVKDRTTLGIGTGEQDRVGVARIAAEKAYRNYQARTAGGSSQNTPESFTQTGKPDILKGAVMISDGFFPFRDGVEVGLKEGVSAVVQPGGSVRDWEVIEACNEYSAAMVFTGERSFRH
ncbi:MAG: IMP cyclohydrolase [Spirochaetaceae bacterium]